MNKQDFSRKIVIVLDKNLEPWQVLNAATHIAAFFGNKMEQPFDTGNAFASSDGVEYPRNTQFPIVALRAKQGQLAGLLEKMRASELLYHAFIREMIETTDDNEISTALSNKTHDQIELLGVGVFGPNETVSALTKSFQLWR